MAPLTDNGEPFSSMNIRSENPAVATGLRRAEAQVVIEGFRRKYNHERPHSSRATSRSFLRRRSGGSRAGVVTSERAPAAACACTH